MPDLSPQSFVVSPLSTAEVEASEQVHGRLADDLRRLIDVTIRTDVAPDRVARARHLLHQAEMLLAEEVIPGAAGIHVNREGRTWNWGNSVVGVRNAIAPPLVLRREGDGSVSSEVELRAAYEGPPGCVHGGVSALMLDHVMGETASAGHTRLTVTGTLSLRYVAPLPLGRVHVEARVSEAVGRKVTVTGRIGPGGSGHQPAVEAVGLFIIPRWAYEGNVPAGIGSLD